MSTSEPTTSVPRPEVSPPGPWAFPTAVDARLSNGLRVLSVDIPGQYVISLRLAIPLRLADEPREREGVAVVMARLLDEGTSEHTSDEFAELLERRGVAFGVGATDGSIGVDLDVPQRFLPDALDLLHQMLARPAFRAAEFSRIVANRLAEIEQERANASSRAARELIATLYAADDRASRPTGGTPQSVANLTRDDVVAFHARHVGPDGATLTVSGDLSGVDLGALLEARLGGWSAPTHVPAGPATAPRWAADARRIVIVDRPGSVQSELAVACPGPDRHVEGGWAPYPVASFVVGGSPTARVDAVLREDKGYTYGIRSMFRPRRAGGLFLTSGSVRAEVTADALHLLLEILDQARDGFTSAEVTDGIDFVSRTAPARFATADAVADELVMLALDDLPLTHTTDNIRAIQALSAPQVSAAYHRFITGDWTVVVVGDAAAIADQIRALGLAAVTVVPN